MVTAVELMACWTAVTLGSDPCVRFMGTPLNRRLLMSGGMPRRSRQDSWRVNRRRKVARRLHVSGGFGALTSQTASYCSHGVAAVVGENRVVGLMGRGGEGAVLSRATEFCARRDGISGPLPRHLRPCDQP